MYLLLLKQMSTTIIVVEVSFLTNFYVLIQFSFLTNF
jgi:hypothetical protein